MDTLDYIAKWVIFAFATVCWAMIVYYGLQSRNKK